MKNLENKIVDSTNYIDIYINKILTKEFSYKYIKMVRDKRLICRGEVMRRVFDILRLVLIYILLALSYKFFVFLADESFINSNLLVITNMIYTMMLLAFPIYFINILMKIIVYLNGNLQFFTLRPNKLYEKERDNFFLARLSTFILELDKEEIKFEEKDSKVYSIMNNQNLYKKYNLKIKKALQGYFLDLIFYD